MFLFRSKTGSPSDSLVFSSDGVNQKPAADLSVHQLEASPVKFAYDAPMVHDCCRLCEAVYSKNDDQSIYDFVGKIQHRFTTMVASDLPDEHGHFALAEHVSNNRKIIYIAIRGSSNASDWATNLNAMPVVRGGGVVHSGWHKRLSHLPLAYLIQKHTEGYTVVTTGHSLGGAVAQLLAAQMLMDPAVKNLVEAPRIKCVTFAAPLVMSGQSVKRMNDLYADSFIHFIHSEDAVPKFLAWGNEALVSSASEPLSDKIVEAFSSISRGELKVCAAGLRALENIAKSIFVDLCYKPFGRYFVINRPDVIGINTPLKNPLDVLSYREFELKLSLLAVHDMAETYGSYTLESIHLSSTERLQYRKIPLSMNEDGAANNGDSFTVLKVPDPVICRISMRLLPQSKIEVGFHGENLASVKGIRAELGLCSVNVEKVPTCSFVSHDVLKFTVNRVGVEGSRSSTISNVFQRNYTPPVARSQSDVTVFKYTDREPKGWNSVAVHIEEYHPFDECSLQELVLIGLYILLFSRNAEDKVPPALTKLRSHIIAILDCVPVSAFMQEGVVFAIEVLKDPSRANKMWNFDTSTRNSVENVLEWFDKVRTKLVNKEVSDSATDTLLSDIQKQMKADEYSKVFDVKNQRYQVGERLGKALSLLDLYTDPGEALDALLNHIHSPLKLCFQGAQSANVGLNYNKYTEYLNALGGCLKLADATCFKSIGMYYNQKQEEIGVVYAAVTRFISNPVLWGTTAAVVVSLNAANAAGLTALVVATLPALGIVAADVFIVGVAIWVGHILSYDGWDSDVIDSSAALRKDVLGRMATPAEVDTIETQNLHKKEKALSEKLSRLVAKPVTNLSSVKDFHDCLRVLYTGTDVNKESGCSWNVAHRLKLMVLSHHLRVYLKNFPIALLEGVSCSGKSTLREMLRRPNNPDKSKFGTKAEHRTLMPEIVFCESNGQTFCIFDNIGVSDNTIKDEHILAMMRQANDIFRAFASATIYVCNCEQIHTNATMRAHAEVTSTMNAQAAHIAMPILTCLNKADKMIDDIEPETLSQSKNYEQDLMTEAAVRLQQEKPFDLRKICDDAYTPRVFTIFDPRIKLPEETANRKETVLVSPREIAEWLVSIFPNSNNKN